MLPSLAVLILLSWIYVAFGDVPLVAGLFYGIKPAVTAIVLHAAWRIGSRVLKHAWHWAVAAAAFVAIFVWATPFPAIVAAAALFGVVGARIAPQRFVSANPHRSATGGAHLPALIDDDTPPPEHARHRPLRLAAVVGVGLLLWVASSARWPCCSVGRMP